jgi:hypothetical protein
MFKKSDVFKFIVNHFVKSYLIRKLMELEERTGLSRQNAVILTRTEC